MTRPGQGPHNRLWIPSASRPKGEEERMKRRERRRGRREGERRRGPAGVSREPQESSIHPYLTWEYQVMTGETSWTGSAAEGLENLHVWLIPCLTGRSHFTPHKPSENGRLHRHGNIMLSGLLMKTDQSEVGVGTLTPT